MLRPEGVDVEGEAEEGAAVDAKGRLRVEVTLAAVVQEGQLVPEVAGKSLHKPIWRNSSIVHKPNKAIRRIFR